MVVIMNDDGSTTGNNDEFHKVQHTSRSIRGVYRGEASVQDIALRRYGGDSSDMANASVNPDNIGFCVPQTKCLPSGLLNGTLCQKPGMFLFLNIGYFH